MLLVEESQLLRVDNDIPLCKFEIKLYGRVRASYQQKQNQEMMILIFKKTLTLLIISSTVMTPLLDRLPGFQPRSAAKLSSAGGGIASLWYESMPISMLRLLSF